MVGAGTVSTNKPSDAAVVLAKPTGKALALTTDCNSRYVYADPYKGAMIAVAEAARNIVCTGGTPLGVTNCLNFGNPYDPEVYWQFSNAIKGMGDACRKFDTPVTGGNVSFYNQSPSGPVYPTPTIGMVGLLEDVNNKMTLAFQQEGDLIYLVGAQKNDIASSEYLHKLHGVEHSPCPYFNLDEEFALQQLVKNIIAEKLIESAHDLSEGGLFVALMESCFPNILSCDINVNIIGVRKDAFWFGEAQSRIVVSVSPAKQQAFENYCNNTEVPIQLLGKVSAGDVLVNNENLGPIASWKESYENAIGDLMKGTKAEDSLTMI